MVILVTTILVFGGAALMFVFEHKNPNTIANMSFIDKVMNHFLHQLLQEQQDLIVYLLME